MYTNSLKGRSQQAREGSHVIALKQIVVKYGDNL